MSAFKDMVIADNSNVFLNLNEFAEQHTIIYDGTRYENVSCVLAGLKEQDRRQTINDHAQGLYLVSTILHCSIADLGGNQPEKGTKIKITDDENGVYFREYNVVSSVCEIGMLRVELEAIDE